MAVRSLNGTSDDIVHTVGTSLSGMTHGTVAAIVQRQGGSDFRGLFYTHASDAAFRGAVNVWENDLITWFTASQSQGQTISANVWYLIVVRKASGSSAPRFSIYNFSTETWSHQNGSNSQANWTSPGAGGTVRFSFQTSSDFWSGLVAMRAAWSNSLPWATNATGDSQIEAAGLESSLQAWLDTSPTSAWRFDQDVVTEDVDDLVGDAHQTSRSGTTVVTGSDPPGFVFDSGPTEVPVGAAAEVDGANPVAATKLADITAAPVQDAARPLAAAKQASLAAGGESDSAQPVTAAKQATAAAAPEADQANPLTATRQAAVAAAAEHDTAPPAAAAKAATVEPATEADSAHPLTVGKTAKLTAGHEADAARPVTGGKTVPLAAAGEADAARPVETVHTARLTAAGESDTARPLTLVGQPKQLGAATTADVARPVRAVRVCAIGAAREANRANGVTHGKTASLQAAIELDTALPLTGPAVVVTPGVLTPGSMRPTLTPGATRPTLTAGATRPVLTPGRLPSG